MLQGFKGKMLLPAVVSVLLAACSQHESYRILQYQGPYVALNLGKNFDFFMTGDDTVFSQGLPAAPNDLIWFFGGDNIQGFLLAKQLPDKPFTMNMLKGIVLVNNRAVGLELNETSDSVANISMLADSSLKTIVSVDLGTLNPEKEALLRRLSKMNADVSFVTNMDSADASAVALNKLSGLFAPEFLMTTLYGENLNLVGNFKSLKMLHLEVDDSIISESLPPLPNLMALTLGLNGTPLPEDFFVNNQQIQSLTLSNPALDFDFLEELPRLKSLSVCGNGNSTTIPTDFYSSLGSLVSLTLNDVDSANLTLVSRLKSLRWLGLPQTLSQQQLVAITDALPNLEVVYLYKTNEVTNYKPLVELKKLICLVITDSVTDYGSLRSLKQLKYLSIPASKNETDSLALAALRKQLPSTLIVPNDGFCLGSGWLLLFVPLVVLSVLVLRRFGKKPVAA